MYCFAYSFLGFLFNACINQGSIPNEWKTHLIVPVHNSGDKADIINYRPISFQCTVSKVLECFIYWSMFDFVSPRLSHQQFGSFENRSCNHKLLLLLYSVTNSIDRKHQTHVIFLDLKQHLTRFITKNYCSSFLCWEYWNPFNPGSIVIFQIEFTRCVLKDGS